MDGMQDSIAEFDGRLERSLAACGHAQADRGEYLPEFILTPESDPGILALDTVRFLAILKEKCAC